MFSNYSLPPHVSPSNLIPFVLSLTYHFGVEAPELNANAATPGVLQFRVKETRRHPLTAPVPGADSPQELLALHPRAPFRAGRQAPSGPRFWNSSHRGCLLLVLQTFDVLHTKQ